MTWWEVEQMTGYIADLEKAMDEWTLSGTQMRHERQVINSLEGKIQQAFSRTEDGVKKAHLLQLAERVEVLREHLTERLKRDVPSRS